jgi:CRP-like cAMP-binding protein
MSDISTATTTRMALLAGLPDDELRVVGRHLHPRALAIGEMLCADGEVLPGAAILVQGRLELLTARPRRRLALVEPGECVGLTALILSEPQQFACRATTESHVLMLRREDFQHLARMPDPLGLHLVSQVLHRLARQLRTIDEALDRMQAATCPPPALPGFAGRQAPEPEPQPVRTDRIPRSRPQRRHTQTSEELLDMIQEYAAKAGLDDLDNIRVVRSAYTRLNNPGPVGFRRR